MRQMWINSAGSLRLALFNARRDWLKSAVWLLGFLVFATVIPWELDSIYGATTQSLQAMIPMLQSPAMIAMVGPVFQPDPAKYTVGTLVAGEMLLFVMLAVAFMNILFVVRYTRQDEEQERMEIIRSLPVGRLAPLNAALIGAFVLNLLVFALTWGGLLVMNISSITVKGAFLYAAACGVTGLIFAAIAAICAQLASTSRAAIAYSGGIMGFLYLLRAAGDIQAAHHTWAETLSRISPLGLALRVEAFVTNQWWPLPYLLGTAVVLLVVAYWLNARRDLGAGLIPPKPGPAYAGPSLSSVFGLALRLQRNALIAWVYGAVVLGASYGSIMNTIANFIDKSPFFQQALGAMHGYTVTEAFASLIMVVLAGIAAAGTLMIAMKVWYEESSTRGELILATAVSRRQFFASHAILALVCSVLLPLFSALGMWGASAIVMKTNPIALSFFLKAMMIYLPAIWVLLGLTLLLIAIDPRISSGVTWGYFSFSFFMGYFGQLFPQLPAWVPRLSPFGLIPNITKDAIHWQTLAYMSGLALVMMVAAFVFYRHRDLQD